MSSAFAYRRIAMKKTAAWHYQQRRLRRDLRLGYVGWPLRLEQIGDRDNLYHCFEQLKREGGPAAGVDGLRAADLSPSEAGEYMGVLSGCLLNGAYRPQKVRRVPIPKPGSDEHRILKIGSLGDRVVGKAVNNAFAPFWETKFMNCSYGFRPARSTWRLLADLHVSMRKLRRCVLVVADVRKAFDNVPVAEVVELHRQALAHLEQDNFTDDDKARSVALVEKVLRGHDEKRTRGIDQGGPYSPTALNVLLHDKLDVPLQRDVDDEPLWFRYADNLAYLASSVSEGGQVLMKIRELLRPFGLTVKDGAEVVDLAKHETAHLLGFDVWRTGNHLHYGVGRTAYDNLHQHLGDAHVEHDPPTAAREAVLGWVDALGPAFVSGDAAEVLSIATRYGFREIALDDVCARWETSWRRWTACLRRAGRRRRRRVASQRAAPPPPTDGSAPRTRCRCAGPDPAPRLSDRPQWRTQPQ